MKKWQEEDGRRNRAEGRGKKEEGRKNGAGERLQKEEGRNKMAKGK